jgi:hypothetical protein
VAINFFVVPDGEMKIIEGSTQWFRDLLKVRDKYGLENWSFEVERHGEAKDPKTKYTILPEEKIDNPLRARIAQVELHDLEAVLLNGGDQAKDDAADTLIDAAVAANIIARLKMMPREDVDAILGELITQYENGVGGEIDPFA